VNALGFVDDEPFFALNGDILTDLDLTAMLASHRDHGAAVSIALHHVEDARAFGLVITEDDGRVLEFREKPDVPIPGEINAGTYLIDPAALDGWAPGAAASVEREIFPTIIGSGISVFGFASWAYWLDLGTPQHYLQAHFDMFEGKVHGVSYPAPWVAAGANVDLRAHLGRWVAVNDGARVGPGAELDDCVVHPDAIVEEDARITASILGPGVRVGRGASVRGCVLGQGVVIAPEAALEHEKVSAATGTIGT
jgi:mannose-1-phosphate guanylyltransferase